MKKNVEKILNKYKCDHKKQKNSNKAVKFRFYQ